MDWGSLGGLFLAIVAILLGQAVEGGHIGSLIQPAAFIVVFFGTLGAVLLQTRLSNFVMSLKMLVWVLKPPVSDRKALARRIAMWSTLARREGILKLEDYLTIEKDPFVKKILRLMIDGVSAEKIQEIGGIDVDIYEARLRSAAKVWDAAGGYAPTVGILGAVMGLIHVMENLSDPNLLGEGIAVAFVATIYGVGLANLFFLPVAYKIRSHIQMEVGRREMVIDAMSCIANGDHPKAVEERMDSYEI
jgi:chemotaxis protein MotA